jgi:selenocysteine lyase/cysteine desulfurase
MGDPTLFPDLTVPAYLNHAAVGPLARPTLVALQTAAAAQATHGLGAFPGWLAGLEEARAAAAALVGGRADQVALVHSTGEAITAVALGLDWRPRDRVVLLRGEFPTNILPWLRAAELFNLDVVWLDAADFHGPSGRGLQAAAEALRGGARLVAVSAVQFQTGLRMPLRELADLAHATGAELAVDAIQALGAVDMASTGADWIAAGGHKWLMAPAGTGLLWGSDAAWGRYQPRLAGWLSVAHAFDLLSGPPGLLRYDKAPLRGPASVEGSNRNHPGFTALAAALRLAGTPSATFAHVQPLLDRVEDHLLARGWRSERSPVLTQRSCILAATPPAGVDLAATVRALADAGVSVTTPDGRLRVSPSWPSTHADVDRLIAAWPSIP